MKATASSSTTGNAPAEVLAFRKQFPIFESKIHLANNSKGALSQAAILAHEEYLESWKTGGAPWHAWVGKQEELRASFAEMIGAKLHEVAVCPSVSVALYSVASCLNWHERPAVVFDDFSFPSVTYLWHAQASRAKSFRTHSTLF